MKHILLTVSLFLSCLAINAEALFDHETAPIEKYMEAKRWQKAITLIKKSESHFKNSPKLHAKLKLLNAKCQINLGNYIDALKIIDSIEYDKPHDWHLVRATAFLCSKKYKDAQKETTYYSKTSGIHLYLPALWIRAKIEMKKELYRKCMASCRTIFHTQVEQKPKGLADFKLSDIEFKNLKEIQKDALQLFYEAREAYDIKTYGMDFAIYRKAREAHFKKQYEKARELYGKIKEGTLKEAAGCYTAECFIAENNLKEACKIINKLFKASPYGLYRGEMLYNIAVSLYLNGGTNNALKVTERLRQWAKTVEKETQDTSHNRPTLENINDALKSEIIDTAPKTFLKNDSCGNIIPTARYPGTINNRLTSPWYMPNLKMKGELLYGFLLGERRRPKLAAKIFSNAKEVTNMQIISDRNAISNLITGIAEGSYLVPKDVDKKNKKFANHIRLACFYYLCDDKDQAEKMFTTVVRHANIHRLPYDAAAARLGLVHCLISRRKITDAVKLIDNMEKVNLLNKTDAFMNAKYLRACIWAKNKGTYGKALKEFKLLGEERRNPVAPKALLSMAIAAANHGDRETCIEACKKLKTSYRRYPISQTAGTLKAAIEKLSSKEKSKFPVAITTFGAGRVVLHRRVVIIPTKVDWKRIRAELNPSDIVLYQIKFVPSNNCQIVRNVWMNLEPEEPSPPNAVGDEICFVRAPILFNKSLMYNFDYLLGKK